MSLLSRPPAPALALAALLGACAATQAEKGGLVPVDLPSERIAERHAPRRIALLVGNQQFDDARWRPLRFPRADAASLAEVLRDPERGAFDLVEVVAPGATREELRRALERVAAADRDERDTVVVYVSSHGTLARDDRGELRRYLVARDTRFDAISETGLAMDELRAAFDRLRSRRKVLILAACHSGGGKSVLPPELETERGGIKSGFFVRPIEEVSRASIVLAASDWGETAREDERLGHDIYTHYLVEALARGADRNGDGAITVSEAHDYARRLTYEFTEGRQRPTAESSEVGVDPVILVGSVRRAGRPELYGYAPRLDGFTIRVDGKPLGELPGGIALDAGRHRVQVAKGGGAPLVETDLELDAGERLDVESLIARQAGRVVVAPRIAALGFLDRGGRDAILGPVLAAGGAVTVREWPGAGMELRGDAVGSTGRSNLAIPGGLTPVQYDVVTAGVALAWRFHAPFDAPAQLLAGPRLSGLWIRRRFDLPATPAPAQSYATLTPGLLLGLEVPITGRLSFGAEAHLDWAVVRIDGENRSTGLAEGLAGLGWRF